VAADAKVDLLPGKSFRQPENLASVDVAPLRGRRSGANPSEAVQAAERHVRRGHAGRAKSLRCAPERCDNRWQRESVTLPVYRLAGTRDALKATSRTFERPRVNLSISRVQ
jgi:hypothetical protein